MTKSSSPSLADVVTDEVLGVSDVRAALDIRSSRGRALASNPPLYRARDRASRAAEVERLRAVESWWDDVDEAAVATALEQIPDLYRPLTTLNAGEALDEVALFEVKRFLYWAAYVMRAASDSLSFLESAWLPHVETVMAAIHPEKRPTPRFHLAADLDPGLADARALVRKAQKREKARRAELETAIVDAFGGRFDVRARYVPDAGTDEAVLEADGRLERSGRVWHLVDTEVDDLADETVAANEAMWDIEAEIRSRLSDELRGQVDLLDEIADALAELDVRIAKVELRREWQGVWGEWSSDVGITMVDGRLPRLIDALGFEDVQPISLELGQAPVIVTGPNMGGKSALLELVGVAQWCAQHAFPIPASACRFSPVNEIVYVGAEEPYSVGETGLSAFGREIRRVVGAWEGHAPRLWLLDELGRGTHPDEGATIAIHVVRSRQRDGDRILAATHFPAVASMADAAHLRIAGLDPGLTLEVLTEAQDDGDEIESALRRAMDYRALPVSADHATVPRDAWLIARILGLPSDD